MIATILWLGLVVFGGRSIGDQSTLFGVTSGELLWTVVIAGNWVLDISGIAWMLSPRIPRWGGPRLQRRLAAAIRYELMIGISVLALIPIFWMVSTSLKTLPETYEVEPYLLLPREPQWGNYPFLFTFERFNVLQLFKNTSLMTVVNLVANVGIAAFVGYGFARLRFPGRNLLFMLVLSGLMVPFIVRIIPLFVLFSGNTYILQDQLGQVFSWTIFFESRSWAQNTYLPLVVPEFFGAAGSSALYIFIMRQYFLTIPHELIEAGRVDGASEFAIWRRIVLPQATPAMVAVAILSLQGSWGAFIEPLIFLRKVDLHTLSIWLSSFRSVQGESAVQWQYGMAGGVLVTLPVFILFLLFQRYFIAGISLSGIKG